jgi:hypothetical protein
VLFHSHADGVINDSRQKYTYHNASSADPLDVQQSTDNIMSYNLLKKATWRWQWEIMHNNIKNYINED